jgi:formylmethanofuran dehydrogenase subunit E
MELSKENEPQQPAKNATGEKNIYKQGHEPTDWWAEIKRMHGHVGPWNVLGWRIGQAALREFDTQWGRHELDIICYVPLRTPYSCIADGLIIGTGNAIGWLDIRLAEAACLDLIHVSIKRKDGTGPVIIFKPRQAFLQHIDSPKPEELEKLSRECSEMQESNLFEIKQIIATQS